MTKTSEDNQHVAVGVYRNEDLVFIASSWEEAERVSSTFYQNRRNQYDKYTAKEVDPFYHRPEDLVPEFIHQVIKIPDEHLYFIFRQGEVSWISRYYMSWEEASRFNNKYQPALHAVRADNEEAAHRRYLVQRASQIEQE